MNQSWKQKILPGSFKMAASETKQVGIIVRVSKDYYKFLATNGKNQSWGREDYNNFMARLKKLNMNFGHYRKNDVIHVYAYTN